MRARLLKQTPILSTACTLKNATPPRAPALAPRTNKHRAGVTVPNDALRRALVIPTDRPLEACLAALPLPLEGLREGPYPVPSTFTMTAR